MNGSRYTSDEVKEAWDVSPRIAKNQASRAIPLINQEISDLKCELEVFNDIAGRELTTPDPAAGPSDADNQQEFARDDEEDSGGIGSQVADPEPEKVEAEA